MEIWMCWVWRWSQLEWIRGLFWTDMVRSDWSPNIWSQLVKMNGSGRLHVLYFFKRLNLTVVSIRSNSWAPTPWLADRLNSGPLLDSKWRVCCAWRTDVTISGDVLLTLTLPHPLSSDSVRWFRQAWWKMSHESVSNLPPHTTKD